jgi:hypothetical protein
LHAVAERSAGQGRFAGQKNGVRTSCIRAEEKFDQSATIPRRVVSNIVAITIARLLQPGPEPLTNHAMSRSSRFKSRTRANMADVDVPRADIGEHLVQVNTFN